MAFDIFVEGEWAGEITDVMDGLGEAREIARERRARTEVFDGDRRVCWIDEKGRTHFYDVGDRVRVHDGTRATVLGTLERIGVMYAVRLDDGRLVSKYRDSVYAPEDEDGDA